MVNWNAIIGNTNTSFARSETITARDQAEAMEKVEVVMRKDEVLLSLESKEAYLKMVTEKEPSEPTNKS